MKDVVSVKTMRESDMNTINEKICSKELMKRAGEAIFNAYDFKGKTAICCGSGNNAGDGYVLGTLLKERCHLFLLRDKFSQDGKFYFDQCVNMGVGYSFFDESTSFSEYDTIVDCILGTGFSGELKGIEREAVEKINSSDKFVISCDIPSGLNGDTGTGESVICNLCISIGTLKTGLILNEARDKIKKLVNCPIGIDIVGERYYLLEKEDFEGVIPERKNHSHKGTYGYTGVWGGCEEYSGAIKLSNISMSALKSGCGVSRLITSEKIAPYVAPFLLESTLFKMEEGFQKEKVKSALEGLSALSIGMGWGKGEEKRKILEYILKEHQIKLVIDADGLNILSGMDLDLLENTRCTVCLTPHIKEFSRLSGLEMDKINYQRAKEFAKRYNAVVLLKGTTTTITDGEEVFFINNGCPGMATAGSGDVLSGILSGLLGYLPLNAKTVALGAYISARAGEIAQEKTNAVSMTSSDTVSCIANAISELL